MEVKYKVTYIIQGKQKTYRNRFGSFDKAVHRAKTICYTNNFLALCKIWRVTPNGEQLVRVI